MQIKLGYYLQHSTFGLLVELLVQFEILFRPKINACLLKRRKRRTEHFLSWSRLLDILSNLVRTQILDHSFVFMTKVEALFKRWLEALLGLSLPQHEFGENLHVIYPKQTCFKQFGGFVSSRTFELRLLKADNLHAVHVQAYQDARVKLKHIPLLAPDPLIELRDAISAMSLAGKG